MARNINLAVDCADCCACPTPTVQWDSRSASKSKCGWDEFSSPSTPPKRYRTASVGNLRLFHGSGNSTIVNGAWTVGLGCAIGACDVGQVVNLGGTLTGSTLWFRPLSVGASTLPATVIISTLGDTCGEDYGVDTTVNNIAHYASIPTVATYHNISGGDDATLTLSAEYLTSELKSETVAGLPTWDDDWNDTAGSFANLSTDELSYAIRESRYRLRFGIPRVGTGINYRASWVERFIPEAGVGIDSIEVYSRGVYRPTVTLSAPPSGGTQARAVAVMSSTGTVSSIRILNPGAGYVSAPTVTVQAASGGGTSSTGWTATLTSGQVTAIAGGSAGNYLPTLVFSGGGGSGATATCALDAQGGISAVTVGAAGSGYTSAPTLAITAKVSGSTAADLLLHLGAETPRCAVWDGITPGGYDPDDATTYPIIGDGTNAYFELPVPSADGTALVANLRAVCNGTPCS